MAGYTAAVGKPVDVKHFGKRLENFVKSFTPLPSTRVQQLRQGSPVVVERHEIDILVFR